MATKKKKTVAKKKKPTLNQQLYQKELRRLKQFIRRTEKRGFHYAEGIIPEKPKRITKKSIERLQKLTSQVLYERATYKDPVTGSELTGVEGRQLERKRAAFKGAKTKSKSKGKSKRKIPEIPDVGDLPAATYEIIENVREEIRKWAPSSGWAEFFTESKHRDKNILENMLEGAIRQEGADVIAARLEAHAYEVLSIVQEILYGSGGKDGNQVNNDFARFSQILLGRGLTVEESIALANAQEYTEDFEEDLVEE